MNGKINQTSINSLKLLESQIDVAPLKGTAIFLVPAPDIAIPEQE
jgi:hypothetical protein